jgi:hypothetical protein
MSKQRIREDRYKSKWDKEHKSTWNTHYWKPQKI